MNDHIQISDVTPRIQYAADGSQFQFSYPFPIFLEDDLEVYLDDTITTSGYAVLGAGTSYGGTVTFDTPPTNGVVVTLRRSLAIERTTDFHQSGAFRAKAINDELDHLTAALQQVADDVSRAVRLRSTAADASLELPPKDDRANKVLGFDASGDVIAIPDSAGTGGGVTNHSQLSGLSDDDHVQYHNNARGDARYYTQAQVDTALGSKSDRTHNHDAAYAAISHVGDTSNPHGVTKSHVGLGDVENIKVNLGANIDPTQNDDGNLGYTAGSRWINTVARKEFVCLDPALGAALWIETTQIGGGAISNRGGLTGLAEKNVSISKYARLLTDEPTGNYRLVPDFYIKRTVVFDGASYLTGSYPSTVSDGKEGTFETYVKFEGNDRAKQVLLAGFYRFEVYKGTDNKIYIDGRPEGVSTPCLRLVSASTFTADSGWLHIVASWDLTNASHRHLYINGVDELGSATYFTDATIEYTRGIGVMCDGAGTPGNIANCIVERIGLWGAYYDLSDPAIMDLFGAGENLADLGEDGTLADGGQPMLFFRGPAADFPVCRAGRFNFDFDVTGTLVDGPSNKGYWHTVGRKLYGPDGKQGRLVGFRHAINGGQTAFATRADFEAYRDTDGVNFNMIAPEIWWSTNYGACELNPTQPGVYNTQGMLELKAYLIQIARAGFWIVPSLRVSFDQDYAAANLALDNDNSNGLAYNGWADHAKTMTNDPVVVDGVTYGNYRDRFFAWCRWVIQELLSEPEIAAAIAYWEMWHFPGHRHTDVQTDEMIDFYTSTFVPMQIALFREYEPDRLLGVSYRHRKYSTRAYAQGVNHSTDDANIIHVIGGYSSTPLLMDDPGQSSVAWPPAGTDGHTSDSPRWIGPGADDFNFVLWSADQNIAMHSQEGPGLDPSKQVEPLNADVKTYLEGLGDLNNRYANGMGWHWWDDRPTLAAGTELGDILRSDAYFGGASLYAFTKVNSSAAKLGANPQSVTNYTLVENDKSACRVTFNSASAVTVNVDYDGIRWAVGDEVAFLNVGSGPVTIQGGGTSPVTISKAPNQTAVLSQGKSATLHFTGGTTAMLFGDMDAI